MTVSSNLDAYLLKRWSTSVRCRDGHRCYMCEEVNRRIMHAHHVYPKHLYPAKAYDLDNGVCVCETCHLAIVHTSEHSWKKWTDFFKRHVRRKAMRTYAEDNQSRIFRRIRR